MTFYRLERSEHSIGYAHVGYCSDDAHSHNECNAQQLNPRDYRGHAGCEPDTVAVDQDEDDCMNEG